MAWVNFGILAGGVLFVALPILLHLLMRQEPKKLVFPALRLVRQKKEINQRTLELRHWLLLLLRCAAICFLAAMLARPSAASADFSDWIFAGGTGLAFLAVAFLALASWTQDRGPALTGALGAVAAVLLAILLYQLIALRTGQGSALLGDEEAPVAAALVYDTAPRMDYKHKNQTRLAAAQAMTREWLLSELPRDSETFVLGAAPHETSLPLDLVAAGSVVGGLKTRGVARPLPETLVEAIRLVAKSDKQRKELYVFTDLTEPAWLAENGAALRELLAEHRDVNVYLIDVGVEEPQNVGLTELRLTSGQTLAPGMPLRVQVDLTRTGPAEEVEVELYVEEPDAEKPYILDRQVQLPALGKPRARQSVSLPAGGAVAVDLAAVSGLPPGTHQGQVKLVRGDGLPVDDVRYFTVLVREPWPLLVVAGPQAESGYVSQALAPTELVTAGLARFRVEPIAQAELGSKELAPYAAIWLLDPGPLPPELWRKLDAYVQAGGHLAVALGRNAFPVDSFNAPEAQALLAGRFNKQPQRSGGRDIYLDPRGSNHPLLAAFFALPSAVPWYKFPVAYHWRVADDQLAPGATVVIRYTNRAPALVERSLGRGTVLTFTTPLSDPPGSRPWNELPISLEAWPFVMLANETALHQVRSADPRLNYLAGEVALLRKASDREPDRFQLFAPNVNYAAPIVAKEGTLTIAATEAVGAYRLRGESSVPGTPGPLKGFAVNLPAEASQLTRIAGDRLDTVLGAGRYQVAQERDEIERGVGEARRGREFYPLLVALLVLIVGLELLLANRFYPDEPAAAA